MFLPNFTLSYNLCYKPTLGRHKPGYLLYVLTRKKTTCICCWLKN